MYRRHREVVMIRANELTGDTGLEDAGQWQAWLRYPSLKGPCCAELRYIPEGVCLCLSVRLDTSNNLCGHYTPVLLSW